MNLSLTKNIQKNHDACATMLDGELIVMSNQDNIYYKINASGIKIWQFMETQTCSLQAIVEFVADIYQVPQDVVHADVVNFVGRMLEKNIFRYV